MPQPEPLPPVGPALGAHNRRIFAAKRRWPAGALEACEQIEAEHPDWYPDYDHGGHSARPAPGYYAQRRASGGRPGLQLHGETPEALLAAIRAHR